MELQIVDNICPYCKEHFMMNKKSFANHVRWCKKNPKYETIKESTVHKINEKALSKRQYYTITCPICGTEFKLFLTEKAYENNCYRKTCSDKCAKILTSLNSKNRNERISLGVRQYCVKNGSRETLDSNLKTFVCEFCGNKFKKIKFSKFCSVECNNKYKHMLSLENKDAKQIYHIECNFKFSLNDFPNEFNFDLVDTFGWYLAANKGNNLTGVSRDHKYSVMSGFRNNIDPYIISHPANCELLCHTDNISKLDKNSITIETLIDNIKLWNNKYGIYPNLINYELLSSKGIHVHKIF